MRAPRIVVVLGLGASTLTVAPAASATTRCVGGAGCYPTIQAAVDAAVAC